MEITLKENRIFKSRLMQPAFLGMVTYIVLSVLIILMKPNRVYDRMHRICEVFGIL